MSIIDGLIIATGVLDFILSAVVLLRNKKSQTNLSFAIFSFFLGAWAFSVAFFRLSTDPAMTLIWAKGIYITGSSIAASLLYFAFVFPQGKDISGTKKALIFIPSTLHAVLLALPSYLTDGITYQPWGKEVVLGRVEYVLFSIYFLLFFYGALYILWGKYKKHSGNVKKQLSFVLGSILLAGIVASVFDLFLPWFGNYQLIFIGPAFSGVIFWLITYAIIRHQLWDFRLIVARSIAYTLLIVWLGCLYTIGVFWISRLFFGGEGVSGNQIFVYTLLALFIAFTFQPLKLFLERATDQIFFKYNYTANDLLFRLSSTLATTLQLENLGHKVLKELLDTVHIKNGILYVSHDKKTYAPISEGHLTHPPLTIEAVAALTAKKRIIIYEEEPDEGIKAVLQHAGMSLAVPLYINDKPHGLLMLGEKKSGDLYSKKDLSILKILGPELAVAIENAKSYAEIKQFNVTLSEEINRATEDLQKANERLKELDHMKDEFVSLASHELRTPMTAIKSYIWMLLKNEKLFDQKSKDYLTHAYEATDRLIILVNDMLNVSRIESGRMVMKFDSIDLQKIIEDTVSEILPEAQKQGVILTVKKAEQPIPEVMADNYKVKEVLLNLIGNAIKFTPAKGSVTISVRRDNDHVVTEVKDTGRGIKPDDMQKIFQKFGLLERGYIAQKRIQGTGLGLYICKSIIEKHQGKIWAESAGENQGSTLLFTLPLAESVEKIVETAVSTKPGKKEKTVTASL